MKKYLVYFILIFLAHIAAVSQENADIKKIKKLEVNTAFVDSDSCKLIKQDSCVNKNNCENRKGKGKGQGKGKDAFIDKDGDGINDNRCNGYGFGKRKRMGKMKDSK